MEERLRVRWQLDAIQRLACRVTRQFSTTARKIQPQRVETIGNGRGSPSMEVQPSASSETEVSQHSQ